MFLLVLGVIEELWKWYGFLWHTELGSLVVGFPQLPPISKLYHKCPPPFSSSCLTQRPRSNLLPHPPQCWETYSAPHLWGTLMGQSTDRWLCPASGKRGVGLFLLLGGSNFTWDSQPSAPNPPALAMIVRDRNRKCPQCKVLGRPAEAGLGPRRTHGADLDGFVLRTAQAHAGYAAEPRSLPRPHCQTQTK